MNEKEKKAIEELSKKAVFCNYEERDYPNMICFKKDMLIVLNLIEKLQKENEKYKRLAKINLENAEEFKDNMCEHRCLLKSENEELKEDLKYVLNQTLGAFEKNWCIDWNFTEIREKYNLESE